MKHMEEYPDEELIDMYRAGDEQAIEYIFERYKYIVRKKAKAMFLAGGDSDDLIQEGMIGLYKAVRDYDKKKDASFMTFAGMCINTQILKERRIHHLIHMFLLMSRSIQKMILR